MDKPPGVFAGLKLSEQAPDAPTPVDQKLFGSSLPSAARPVPSNSAPPPAPAVAPAPAPTATRPPHQAAEPRRDFDLADIPYRKETYLFTSDEFEALEDLKLTLRRQHDLKASKNDLARCAIQYLLEDFRRNGDRSPVIAPLKRRSSR